MEARIAMPQFVCPLLRLLKRQMPLPGTTLALGSQNVADAEQGAFTGEISASMLAEYACRYAIVGHSERRQLYNETNALVAARYAHAIKGGITPVFMYW